MDYNKILKKEGILNDLNGGQQIANFDKSRCRVGVMWGKRVFVPAGWREFYEFSPRDRRQVTIIEGIIADGRVIPGMTIVAGQLYQDDWFC